MRQAVTLAGLSALNVALSFVYQWYVFVVLGPGWQTDALFAGMTIPLLVLGTISGSLTHVLVPLLATEDRETYRRDAWTFVCGIALLFGVFAIVLGLTAPHWVPLTVPGFDERGTQLTIRLLRIQLIGVVLSAVTGALWSALHARRRFVWAEVSPVASGLLAFPILLLGLPALGVAAAAYAFVARTLLQTVLLLPALGGFCRPAWGTPAVREAWRRLRPLLLGSSYYKLEVFVDRFLASLAPAGGLSLLHLAQQLYAAGHTVLNTALAAPAVPRLASHAHERDWTLFRRLSRQRLGLMLAAGGIAVAAAAVVGRPLLSLLFGHGRFGPEEITHLWWLVLALGGMFLGGVAGQILALSFYALGDTSTPTRIGVVGFTLGIGLKVGGFYLFGVLGIALGTSVYYLLNAVLLFLFLQRRLAASLSGSHERSTVFQHT